MAQINLLPWREWQREQKQREFLINLLLVALLAAGAVYAITAYLDGNLSHQQARNRYVESQLTVLDSKIVQIKQLRDERENLLARMRVIQQLQGNRPVIVHVFDDLVRTLAGGVFFNKLSMDGSNITVSGIAESNNRVSDLMRRLDDSEWFADPNLKSIKENAAFGSQASNFNLTVRQVNPNGALNNDG